MRNLIITSLIIIISSCSTMHLKYEGTYQTKEGKVGNFVYEKGYSTGSYQVLCALTGIFYGGACWAYVGFPSANHVDKLKEDARLLLVKRLNTEDLTIEKKKIERVNWEFKEEELKLLKFGEKEES